LFRGFLINKFRGDLSLFASGAEMIESRVGAPCIGVFPFAGDMTLDAEDTLALDVGRRTPAPPAARIGIVRFPCVSNATDFQILPGSKHTLSDLAWLRSRGLASWIVDQHRKGTTVIGVCGGFQMLGEQLADPYGVESSTATAQGLGLLPTTTVLERSKTIAVRQARTRGGAAFEAYEIHLGMTTSRVSLPPFAFVDGVPEGIWGDRVVGTYLHGSLESAAVCSELFGIEVKPGPHRTAGYQHLADWFDRHCRLPPAGLL
jgi:adenosylcobyric acid synthase